MSTSEPIRPVTLSRPSHHGLLTLLLQACSTHGVRQDTTAVPADQASSSTPELAALTAS